MNSLWLSHPTGNVFVRALLRALKDYGWDYHFFTTLGFPAGERWWNSLPRAARAELSRRSYEVPGDRLTTSPWREGMRLLSRRFAGNRPGSRVGSVDAVYHSLDLSVATALERAPNRPAAVYAYEDGALATFQAARELGLCRVYDLPILYWTETHRILAEEAERWPDWEPTLGTTRDAAEKLERKTRELALADLVVCPGNAVLQSLPADLRATRNCIVAHFGSPAPVQRPPRKPGKLRVLFAGQMSQRKGLADLFAAMKLLRRQDVELVVLGTPILPTPFYRSSYANFLHEPARNHAAVLETMSSCDLLVLPSLVEGRALVQQEALACGLPLIVTANAGAPDLIDGGTGFLIPIRLPQAIAERIDWFASHRDELEQMRDTCRQKAARYTWQGFAEKILAAVSSLIRKVPANP